MPASPPAPEIAQRLALILLTVRTVIAARAGRNRAIAPVVLLTWRYLIRLSARFDALARRVACGKGAAAPARPRPASATPRCRASRLPGGFAWLIRLVPEAAPLGGQLRHLLTDPEVAALLAAAPQAARLLGPLCRMLGVEQDPDLPPTLFRPPAPPRSTARTAPCPEPDAPAALPGSPAPHRPLRKRRRRLLLFGPALA